MSFTLVKRISYFSFEEKLVTIPTVNSVWMENLTMWTQWPYVLFPFWGAVIWLTYGVASLIWGHENIYCWEEPCEQCDGGGTVYGCSLYEY